MLLLIVVVVCGCLAALGIIFSTNLAHFGSTPTASRSQARRGGERQRRSQQGGIAASYSRYSSDQQDVSSIAQQQRKCREAALTNGHDLKPELEFADEAISGSRIDRDGLQRVLAAARAGQFQVLYFESLSRLARELILSQTVLKELVYVHSIRVISTSEGMDSDRAGWEIMSLFRSWMHGEFLKQLREAVLRGQEEAVLDGYSVGQWCFGYQSIPVANADNPRSRHAKPRMRIVIEEEHANWVRQVFEWFVVERRSLAWITRELTRRQAPKDHRATTPQWRQSYVVRLLRNTKYIGLWSWGKKTNVRNPLTGQIRQEDCPSEELAAFTHEYPDLRIVADEVFFQAQGLLDHNEEVLRQHRQKDGRLRGSTVDTQNPRHLLQGLVKCAQCQSTFQVAGAHGRYLRCDGYRTGICPVKTQLRRELVERMLLDQIGAAILSDPAWKEYLYHVTLANWEHQQHQQPSERAALEKQLSEVEKKINRLIDVIEDDAAARGDLKERLEQRRRERGELQRRLNALPPFDVAAPAPTREWIEAQLTTLHQVLIAADPAAALALRQLVGTIVVTEYPPVRGKRNYLVGEYQLGIPAAVLAHTIPLDGKHGFSATRTLVFVEPLPWVNIADAVKTLFDQGLRLEAIATELGCHRSWPAKSLTHWYTSRGLPVPDGRQLRERLEPTPELLAIEERAMELWQQGLLMQEIATQLACCRDTITALIRAWHMRRGLPVPDGRHRRKTLPRGSAATPQDHELLQLGNTDQVT